MRFQEDALWSKLKSAPPGVRNDQAVAALLIERLDGTKILHEFFLNCRKFSD